MFKLRIILNYLFAVGVPFSHIFGYAAGIPILASLNELFKKLRRVPLVFWLEIFIIYGFFRALFSCDIQTGMQTMLQYISHWFLPFILGFSLYNYNKIKNVLFAYLMVFAAIVFFSDLSYFHLFPSKIAVNFVLSEEGLLKALRSHIALGALLVMNSFIISGIFFETKDLSRLQKTLLISLLTLFVFSIFLTGSRGYYIASLVSFLLFGVFYLTRRVGWKKLLAFFLLIFICYGVIYTQIPSIKRRIDNAGPNDPSVQGRLVLYKVAFQEIEQRPVFGFGPGQGIKQLQFFKGLHPDMQLLTNLHHLHSFYLNILADFGLTGAVIFVFLILNIFRELKSIAKANSGIISAVAMGLVWGLVAVLIGDIFDTLLRGPGVAMEIFWILGLVSGANYHKFHK